MTAEPVISKKSRRSELRRRFLPFYFAGMLLLAASFLWQMLHGICPVP